MVALLSVGLALLAASLERDERIQRFKQHAHTVTDFGIPSKENILMAAPL